MAKLKEEKKIADDVKEEAPITEEKEPMKEKEKRKEKEPVKEKKVDKGNDNLVSVCFPTCANSMRVYDNVRVLFDAQGKAMVPARIAPIMKDMIIKK